LIGISSAFTHLLFGHSRHHFHEAAMRVAEIGQRVVEGAIAVSLVDAGVQPVDFFPGQSPFRRSHYLAATGGLQPDGHVRLPIRQGLVSTADYPGRRSG